MEDKRFRNEHLSSPAVPVSSSENQGRGNRPLFPEGWLDDLDEAITDYERAVEEADEIIRLY